MNRFKRLLFSIHSWFGLITGIFLLLLGLSGSILVFKDELDETIYHKVLTVKPQGKKISLDSLYKIITNKYSNLDGIAWLNPLAAKDQSYHFRLYLNDARLESYDLGAININQYTGEMLRSGRSDDLEVGWIEWIYQFHFSLHLGVPGAALTAIFGLTMLISIITGFVVYRKFIRKVLTFKVKIKTKNWRMLSSDLHRVVGVWSLFLNVIVFFTGFWMNLFAFDSGSWEKEKIPTPNNTLVKASLDKMYAESLQKMPDLVPNYVYLPTQANKKFSVRGNLKGQNPMFAGGNVVQFDAQTGEFLNMGRFENLVFWEKVETLFFPLHVGNYGGIPVKILYIILGLTPGLLAITGFMLWWRHKMRVVHE